MTNYDVGQISTYLETILKNPNQAITTPDIQDENLATLFRKIEEIIIILKEVYVYSIQLADGNLKINIQSKNIYMGSLKDLQASLKHLLWQINRIASGDYQVNVDFLGDFTISFKHLIVQLQERETILRENIRLSKELTEQQLQLLENELEYRDEKHNQFVKSTEEIRNYRHDMQNHLLCIQSLLQVNDIDGAVNYIQLLRNVFSSTSQTCQSENFILDALLNEKLGFAESMGVKVKKKIILSKKILVENKDWCILIGNALDNCLEALQEVEERERRLSIILIYKQGALSVKIGNTFRGELLIENNQLKTSKKNRNNHGIGLKNIKDTVRKYEGEMHFKTEDHFFELIFILFNV